MKFKFIPPLLMCSAVMLMSCQQKPEHSTDLTAENVFTPGIEGPAVDNKGNLFAVNFEKEGTVGIVDPLGKGSIFLSLPEGSTGNGIEFDLNGNMFIADYSGHKVYRVAAGSDLPEIWAQNPEMNQPNDLAVSDNGLIYLSDPDWKNNAGNIWMVNHNREIVLLEADMGTTNGIEISPDGKKLYVNESVQRIVWQYDINRDGGISNKRKLIEFPDFGMDGMRCDANGNLYIARYGKGTVVAVSPEGTIINEILLTGKNPSNITFGGPEGKTCFVTLADRGCIESFNIPVMGGYISKIKYTHKIK